MKFLFDLFPVIFFFFTLKVSEKTAGAGAFLRSILDAVGIHTAVKPDMVPIMLATVAVIVASIIQIAWVKLRHGKVEKTLWISAVLVVVLGFLTLYLQDDAFIKWKPTILYWLFAAAIFISQWFWNKNIIRAMMDKNVELPEHVWTKMNLSWAGFFTGLGFLNLFVAKTFSTDTWATFKLFGATGIMFVFIIVQMLMIQKYLPKEDESKKDES
ncbi:MAG TPA: septation protein A [Methylotenera sp.]|nr:septation protein A [Methylotenera sp.]HPH05310.1 septation protein A [Methylotenera sp.]HPN00212.1 septation protein A [Methylotenera sp.]